VFGEGALEGEDAYCYWLGGGVHGAICRLDCWLQQGTDDDLGRGEERERDGGLIFFLWLWWARADVGVCA
jgi:hypothetical protein